MGVFGLRLRVARLHLGDEHLELQQFLAPRGRPAPVDARSNDRWFQHVAIIVSDMDKAYQRLRKFKVEHASSGPQLLPAWNPNAGGISAFYFRDPDGNVLEILHFPDGKGLPKWHQATDRLFLGIDHTAIVVADTEASLRLYRDLLGLKVVGGAENFGTEQEHLNNVFGARLKITALRAANGFGVEFLEYLAPRTGRPSPLDTQANDRWWGQINLVAPALDAHLEALRAGQHALVSPGAVDLPSPDLRARRGALAKDSDGHGLMFRQP
jgi:catechol 2,3-dioxygenase-like lactoylglutathione lyase family enzyme